MELCVHGEAGKARRPGRLRRAGGWAQGGRGRRRISAASVWWPLAATVGDDHLGGHTQEDPGADHQQAELAVAELAHRAPDLADHVEDGAGGDRVEEKLERLGGDVVAHDRAEEDGTSADETGEGQPSPARADVAERADDPEALRGVVDGKADDQDRGEPDLSGASGDADREALGEVVQPDR